MMKERPNNSEIIDTNEKYKLGNLSDPLAPARGCLLGVGLMVAVWIAVILVVRMIF